VASKVTARVQVLPLALTQARSHLVHRLSPRQWSTWRQPRPPTVTVQLKQFMYWLHLYSCSCIQAQDRDTSGIG